MSKLVLLMGVSLDGMVARPGRFGAAFAQSLSRLRLVDEYRLVLQPVALGCGLPLIAGLTKPVNLDLVEAQPYGDGSVLYIYRPAGSQARQPSVTE